MAEVMCPSCGKPVNVPDKKTGLWWRIGCVISALGLSMALMILGLLAAIAIPSFARAREVSQMNACVINLRAIKTAKQEFATANGLSPGQAVTEEQLAPYLCLPGAFNKKKCPGGGTYTVGVVGEEPQCSVHGSLSSARGQHRQESRTK
jgi:hypothetical protein